MDDDMSNKNGKEALVVTQSLLDQYLFRLRGKSPLVENPSIPDWALKQLVATERIIRLRRNLYLVPDREGKLPSLGQVPALIDTTGYLSFAGALAEHGLINEDPENIVFVSKKRISPLKYGPKGVYFYTSPKLAKEGVRTLVGGSLVPVASVEQALVDCSRTTEYAPSFEIVFEALRLGLLLEKTTEKKITKAVLVTNSATVARRLGFLMEVCLGTENEQLLALAQTNNSYTLWGELGNTKTDSKWRIHIPDSFDPTKTPEYSYEARVENDSPRETDSSGEKYLFFTVAQPEKHKKAERIGAGSNEARKEQLGKLPFSAESPQRGRHAKESGFPREGTGAIPVSSLTTERKTPSMYLWEGKVNPKAEGLKVGVFGELRTEILKVAENEKLSPDDTIRVLLERGLRETEQNRRKKNE